MAIKNKRDLLLISVDSPVMLGIYENKKLVKSFSAEGKFSDSLPNLFSKIFAESSVDSANFLLDSAPTTQDANSSIFDEKSGLCSYEREDRTNGSSTKRATKQGEAEVSLFNLPDLSQKDAEFANIYYTNGPGNFSAIKLTHIFLQTLSITKNIPLFCADAFHFSDNEFINAYGKVHFYKKDGEIHTATLDSKRVNSFSLPSVLDFSIFSADCAPLYILPAV